jgi:uncharacterized delta-60 repeat protein
VGKRRGIGGSVLAAAALATLAMAASAQAASFGQLDPTFGGDGIVTTPMSPGAGNDQGFGMAIQPADGKVVVAGVATFIGGTDRDFAVARYNTNGSLDQNFGAGGIVTTPIGADVENAIAVAIQADGKIVAGGYSDQGPTTGQDFALVRYNDDGSLDDGGDGPMGNGFGGDGIVTTAVSPGSGSDFINDIAIQPGDGKIVAAGAEDQLAGAGSDMDFALARYNAVDGSLDTTGFGSPDGFVHTDFTGAGAGSDDEAAGVALQTDGKIVAAGIAKDGSATGHTALARYHPDGTLDTDSDSDTGVDLSADGKVVTAVSTGAGDDDQAYDVAIQPNGKIVAAGGGGNNGFGMARYNPNNGTLDDGGDGTGPLGFGSDGIVTTPMGSNAYAFGIALQADTKIVLAGQATGPGGQDTGLARYNGSNGTLDTGFGLGGKLVTAVAPGTNADNANDLAIQTNGKIVAAGAADVDPSSALNIDFAVVRYGPVPVTTSPPPATPPAAATTTAVNPLCASLHKKLKKAKTKAKKRKIRRKLRNNGC